MSNLDITNVKIGRCGVSATRYQTRSTFRFDCLSQRSRNQRKNFADNIRQLSLAKNTAHKSSVDAWLHE